MNDNKYVPMVYNMLLNDLQINALVSGIKNTLQSLGLNNAWIFQTVGNNKLFLELVKRRVDDQYIQKLYEDINSSSRAKTYKLFANLKFQPYLDILTITKYRKATSRLKMSSHRLQVESGRWHKPASIPISERKCTICNKLEDEYHFMFECSLYTELRNKYIKS